MYKHIQSSIIYSKDTGNHLICPATLKGTPTDPVPSSSNLFGPTTWGQFDLARVQQIEEPHTQPMKVRLPTETPAAVSHLFPTSGICPNSHWEGKPRSPNLPCVPVFLCYWVVAHEWLQDSKYASDYAQPSAEASPNPFAKRLSQICLGRNWGYM